MTIEVNGVKLSDRTVSYLGTAMWSSTVMLPVCEDDLFDGCMDVDEDHVLYGISENDSVDDHFDLFDFDEESLRKAQSECDDFFDYIEEKGWYSRAEELQGDDRIAHDFWLTRNGHGAGFWDGDYGDFVGGELTRIAKRFSEQTVLVNLDGSIGVY